jgi:hypothetical protein
MLRTNRLPLLAALGLSFIGQGCTTWQPLPPASEPLARIDVGQRLRLVETDGAHSDIHVTAVEAGFIEGSADDGSTVRFAIDEVDDIQRRERSPGKTGGLVAGLIVGGLVLRAGIIGAGGAAVLSAGY